ncbi:MAG TPA: SDR family NAD(P)-dependent oxidoreductase, partial [Dokdonella sp.]
MKRIETKGRNRSESEGTVARQRRIQSEVDAEESRAPKKKNEGGGATQAGPARQPAPPLPKQHLKKPGREADLTPRPRFEAKEYRGSGKLEGMVALITGADSGIGRAVAVLFAREGADVAVVYLSENEDAEETQRYVEREGRRCLLLRGDVRDVAFCNRAVERTIDTYGKLDILVNNAAFQQH